MVAYYLEFWGKDASLDELQTGVVLFYRDVVAIRSGRGFDQVILW
jgi:hypothetical protein